MKTNLYDYIVEWDDAKDELNYQKHGIRFETAEILRLISARYATKAEELYYGSR